MKKISREEIYAQAAKKLRSEFEELSIIPHNASKGHEAEEILKQFLIDHIPRRFSVGAGFILDHDKNISPQTDLIIYDAFNCPVYRASDDASIFPSNNVAVVIEVKSNLDKNELEDAWAKISEIKSMSKSKSSSGPLISQTAGFLFAYNSKITLTKLSEHYKNLFFKSHGIGQHIDGIVVLDKGIINLAANIPGVEGWNTMFWEGSGGPLAEGSHIAISINQFHENTLDAFFRILLSQLSMFRHIIDHPGFGFSQITSNGKEQLLTYLTSITFEKDPILRERKVKQYIEQVKKIFEKTPVPENWE